MTFGGTEEVCNGGPYEGVRDIEGVRHGGPYEGARDITFGVKTGGQTMEGILL